MRTVEIALLLAAIQRCAGNNVWLADATSALSVVRETLEAVGSALNFGAEKLNLGNFRSMTLGKFVEVAAFVVELRRALAIAQSRISNRMDGVCFSSPVLGFVSWRGVAQ